MKKIEAIIQPFQAEATKEALNAIGVPGVTICPVRGFGVQQGHTEVYRDLKYALDCVPKVKLEIIVPDESVEEMLGVILKASYTGQVGDGKIFVRTIEEANRIRTRESGDAAVSTT